MSRGRIVAQYDESPDNEISVIVEFTHPPLGPDISREKGSRTQAIQQWHDGIRQQHRQFALDLERISGELTGSTQSRLQAASLPRVEFEYAISLNGVALRASRGLIDQIRHLPYILSITEDRQMEAFDDESNRVIGAQMFWAEYGIEGDSVDIAILDTGIDYLHEALGGAPFPNSKVVGGYDFFNRDDDPMDDHGHGTHVAGIAAADGPGPMFLKGVAPKARLWAFKVLGRSGVGNSSHVIAALERALDPDRDPATPTPIQVINMSLGGNGDADDPVSRAVDNAVASGVVCVVAAGNNGPRYQTITSPGSARRALTVGATSNLDVVQVFSSRGPTDRTFSIKPDVVAPGYRILSSWKDGVYNTISGTSMATPHVAGAAALLRQLHPTWSAEEIKSALIVTAHDVGRDAWTQGGGRVFLPYAAEQTVLASPGSLSFGLDDNVGPTWSVTRSITFRNRGSDTITLELGSGHTLPPGVSLNPDPSAVTLAPGDSSTVQVEVMVDNTVFGFPSGDQPSYAGLLQARSDRQSAGISIPYSFLRSPYIRLLLDEPPAYLYVTSPETWPRTFSWLTTFFRDTMTILVPTGTYDVITEHIELIPKSNQTIRRYSIKENILVTGRAQTYISPFAARHSVRMIMKDAAGILHSESDFNLRVLRNRETEFALTSFGQPWNTLYFFDSVSARYSYEVVGIPRREPTSSNLFVNPFVVKGGIERSIELETDPYRFIRLDFRPLIPELVDQVNALAEISLQQVNTETSPAAWVTGNHPLLAPYSQIIFVQPTDSDFSLRPVRVVFHAPTDLFLHDPLALSGFFAVTNPDTLTFYREIPLVNDKSRYRAIGGRHDVGLGFSPPMWSGRFDSPNIASTYISDSIPGFFVGPTGDIVAGDIGVTVYADTTFVRSMKLTNDNESRSHYVRLSPGLNRLVLTFEQYKIGGVFGKATASVAFRNRSADRNPPFLDRFLLLSNGRLEQSLPPTDLRFIPSDDRGISWAGAAYKRTDGTEWISLPTSRDAREHVAYLPKEIAPGYYSIRIDAEDTTGNTLEYRVEPAFFVTGFSIDKRTLAFQSTTVGCRQSASLLVQNINIPEGIAIRSIRSDNSNFTVSPQGGRALPLWESMGIHVTFAPIDTGLISGNILIDHSGPTSPETINVRGSGFGSGEGIAVQTPYNFGWNMISLPVEGCPVTLPGSFRYTSTYIPSETLVVGRGYWKRLTDGPISFAGLPVSRKEINLDKGWNLIGSVSSPLPVAAVTVQPDTILGSFFYGYNGGYLPTDTIRPGNAYWVRSRAPGVLTLGSFSTERQKHTSVSLLDGLGWIELVESKGSSQRLYYSTSTTLSLPSDYFTIPPLPPEGVFDVRFASGSILEQIGNERERLCRLMISSADFPIEVNWSSSAGGAVLAWLCTTDTLIELDKAGSIRLEHPDNVLALKLSVREKGVAETFALEQNYPNPFNPKTSFVFQVPSFGFVKLRIFDLLGREIAILVNEEMKPGRHEVTWDASDVPSGVYYYQLTAQVKSSSTLYTRVKKLVLLR